GDADPAVAVLSPSAGLLLVLALALGLALERLPVGDPRLGDLGMHSEFARQPTDDECPVPSTQAPDQALLQLPAVFVLEGRIFLVELVEPVGELLLLSALFDL